MHLLRFSTTTVPQDLSLSGMFDGVFPLLTLNSHEWPKQNFSLQYQYNIKQTNDENKEKVSIRGL